MSASTVLFGNDKKTLVIPKLQLYQKPTRVQTVLDSRTSNLDKLVSNRDTFGKEHVTQEIASGS